MVCFQGRIGCLVAAVLLASGVFSPLASAAAPAAADRVEVRKAEALLKRASTSVRAKKYQEASDTFRDAQETLAQLAAKDSPELASLTAPLEKQAARLREQLEAAGVKLPEAKAKGAAEPTKGVSFTRQVAPLLVAKCGTCHVQRNRGGLSMGSYVSLGQGSESGSVIMPGDAKGSRLIELVESGDMPRGGAKVTAEELELLTSWINAGAKFDGPDSAAPLTSFKGTATTAGTAPSGGRAKIKVVAAGADDEVQFARDLGAILIDNCTECHSGRNPRGNFSLASFDRLLRGGDSGAVIVPEKPEESLLIKKLRGTAGERMPLQRDPLEDAEIEKIAKWIALGAKFDGPSPSMPIEELVERSIAERSTHAELMAKRKELAAKNWRLILPDAPSRYVETADVLVQGGASEAVLDDVARVATEQASKIRKLFKLPADGPLITGRVTLFVFEKRYDYGEVGTMLERREIPPTSRGHWHFTPVDAYGCILLPSDGNAGAGVVAQQIAGTYVASLGKVPRWFAEGSARAVAAKLDPKDPRIKLWDEQIGRTLQSGEKATGFLTDEGQSEENDALSYGFVKSLLVSQGKYTAVLTALREGTPFDEAFSRSFGARPKDLVPTWLARANKRSR